ncbi:hypothetical protein SLI_2499 [Streptomyces lividans 1326]|uniref:Uncharacterized protein n=1 Tax=Streptomyces lividans 1326 TaxID=1200984 RepID=A0A7U9HAM9_STRLI|nr:hypothetical protein SLI_2499 [Streptomyces lividans 1326]
MRPAAASPPRQFPARRHVVVQVDGDDVRRRARRTHRPQPRQRVRPPHDVREDQVVRLHGLLQARRGAARRHVEEPSAVGSRHGVARARRVQRHRPHPVPRQQRQLPAVRHPARLRQPGRHLHGGAVVRVGEQHLPYAGQGVPGPRGGERGAGRQVEQQRAVHQQRGRRTRVLALCRGTGRAGTVGAGESRGGTGAEQSHVHAPIFAGHPATCAPESPRGADAATVPAPGTPCGAFSPGLLRCARFSA